MQPLLRPRPFLHLLVVVLVGGGAIAQAPQWVQRQAPMPLSQCSGQVVYDAARHQTMLVTGTGCNQVWTWDGVTWTQRQQPTGAPMNQFQLCYDAGRQVVVGVFGDNSTGLQTWEWDGMQWLLRMNGGLSGRYGFALAYDAARAVTVLFGGRTGNDSGFAETWTWNGQTWTQVMNGGPTPRYYSAMVFDEQLQTLLLFGGEAHPQSQSIVHGDTWEWNGSQWINHFGLAGPPGRRSARLAYDPVRQRAVLYGGDNLQNGFTDTWEWNGSAWAQVQPLGNPGTFVSGLCYDSDRGVMVVWRGLSNPSQTWEYLAGPGVPATYAAYGSGCAGPDGVPLLTNVAGSVPRVGSTLQLQLSNLTPLPFAIPLGFVGFDDTTWNGIPLPADLTPLGFTGCQLWIAPVIDFTLSNVGGTAAWNVAIPMNSFYLGDDLYFQAVVLAPGWNPASFIVSNAGHGVIGNP